MYDMGARLQALRKAKGWSQEALGRKVNKAKSVISSYEANLRTPPLDVLTSLAALYGVSLDYLAGIEKREMISSEGLSDAQRSLVQTIVVELQSPNPHGARTLTPPPAGHPQLSALRVHQGPVRVPRPARPCQKSIQKSPGTAPFGQVRGIFHFVLFARFIRVVLPPGR